MNELETNVAKIQLGHSKQASTYVFLVAEKGPNDTELFVICELPLFNPAAREECERLSEAVASSLRRSLKKPFTETSFENALSQVNEELGKLAGLGKTHWMGKLNALLAVRNADTVSIATTGKMTGLLLRDQAMTPIAENSKPTHLLKTFENFSVGKIKVNDILIFSTTQLLNHISLERLTSLLEEQRLTRGVREIISTLQDTAGPEIAFATIVAQMLEPGNPLLAPEPEQADEEPASPAAGLGSLAAVSGILKKTATQLSRLPQATRDFLGGRQKPDITRLVAKNRQAFQALNRGVNKGLAAARQQLNPQNFKSYSRQKKFFAITAGVLLLALIVNIGLVRHYKAARATREQFTAGVNDSQKMLNDATSSLLYHDESGAHNLFAQARSKIEGLAPKDSGQQQQTDVLKKQLADLQLKLEKRVDVTPSVLATLGSAERLIVLPKYFATETNRTIISYDRSAGKVQDNALRGSEKIIAASQFKDTLAVTYSGSNLLLWNWGQGSSSFSFGQDVPQEADAAGLEFYAANNRTYMVDKKQGRVVSFATGDKGFSSPVVSVTNADFSKALDLAVDGNVYVLGTDGVAKYQSGRQADFNNQDLRTPLDGRSKIFVTKDTKNVYVLNPGAGTISVMDKKGTLIKTLASPQLAGSRDFTVDEPAKTIYVLSDASLLKLNF